MRFNEIGRRVNSSLHSLGADQTGVAQMVEDSVAALERNIEPYLQECLEHEITRFREAITGSCAHGEGVQNPRSS